MVPELAQGWVLALDWGSLGPVLVLGLEQQMVPALAQGWVLALD
jgi:hypothetical protein